MAPDTPRVLYVALLAAALLLVGIAVGDSAQANACDSLDAALASGQVTGYIAAGCGKPGNAYRDLRLVPIVYGSGVSYLPDPAKTPGSVYPDDEATICGRVNGLTYEKRSRASLTQSMKAAITRAYGQEPGQDGDHELDHRVPAALGGKSDASNVWWQPGRGHGTIWDYHVKDRLDTFAWRQTCVLHVKPLDVTRGWFMEPDWTRVYCREIGGAPCDSLSKP